jgi:hypothetical protein
MRFMTEKWNGMRKSKFLNSIDMRKAFMYFMFIYGTLLIIKGVFNFLPFEIRSNINFSTAYNYGHAAGYLIGKFAKIGLGLMMIKYGYETYLETKMVK